MLESVLLVRILRICSASQLGIFFWEKVSSFTSPPHPFADCPQTTRAAKLRSEVRESDSEPTNFSGNHRLGAPGIKFNGNIQPVKSATHEGFPVRSYPDDSERGQYMQSGQVFESHLTGLAVVTVYVMTHGNIRHSTESVRGREATPSIYFNQNTIDTQIQHVFNTEFDPVFAVRMIPALRFDSQSGSLLVADLWVDTKYKPFTSAKARELLSPTTPLIAIANAARAQASETPGSQVTVSVIGNEPTQTLTKGARLTSLSSYSRKDCSFE